MFRDRKGFTLIELMIMVAIIGILVKIAIPKFANLIAVSKDAATKGNLGTIRSALSIYYGNTEGWLPHYPSNITGTGLCTILEEALVPGYLTVIPNATPSIGGHPPSGEVRCYWNMTGQEDGPGWKYDQDPADIGRYPFSEWGMIQVACWHRDARGNEWSKF